MINQDKVILATTTVSHPATQQVIRQTQATEPVVTTGSLQKTYETKKAIFRTYQIIWYILGVIEVLLAFRIMLKLLGANTQSGFTDFIYTVSSPFALPFSGILGITAGRDLLIEWSTLIAMAVYAVIAYGIVALFQLVKPTSQEEVNQSVDSQ